MDDKDLILSQYLDAELPEDVQLALAKALEHDPVLQARLDRIRRAKDSLRADAERLEAVMSSREAIARERVRERISASLAHQPRHVPFWKRGILLPVPVLAACGIVLAGTIGFVGLSRAGEGPSTIYMAAESPATIMAADNVRAVSTETPVFTMSDNASLHQGATIVYQIQDLEALISLLEQQRSTREQSINLPDSADFVPLGEPVIITAPGNR